ncbi:hypothetical protein DFJ73DRAFT_511241 [Zopfochytrium polystomum]|nr:hypothetical protein DFJ73DRAFT_511241 [Zopfochytrium polystomum]
MEPPPPPQQQQSTTRPRRVQPSCWICCCSCACCCDCCFCWVCPESNHNFITVSSSSSSTSTSTSTSNALSKNINNNNNNNNNNNPALSELRLLPLLDPSYSAAAASSSASSSSSEDRGSQNNQTSDNGSRSTGALKKNRRGAEDDHDEKPRKTLLLMPSEMCSSSTSPLPSADPTAPRVVVAQRAPRPRPPKLPTSRSSSLWPSIPTQQQQQQQQQHQPIPTLILPPRSDTSTSTSSSSSSSSTATAAGGRRQSKSTTACLSPLPLSPASASFHPDFLSLQWPSPSSSLLCPMPPSVRRPNPPTALLLSDDVWLIVACLVAAGGYRDLVQLGRVCKRFATIVSENRCWFHAYTAAYPKLTASLQYREEDDDGDDDMVTLPPTNWRAKLLAARCSTQAWQRFGAAVSPDGRDLVIGVGGSGRAVGAPRRSVSMNEAATLSAAEAARASPESAAGAGGASPGSGTSALAAAFVSALAAPVASARTEDKQDTRRSPPAPGRKAAAAGAERAPTPCASPARLLSLPAPSVCSDLAAAAAAGPATSEVRPAWTYALSELDILHHLAWLHDAHRISTNMAISTIIQDALLYQPGQDQPCESSLQPMVYNSNEVGVSGLLGVCVIHSLCPPAAGTPMLSRGDASLMRSSILFLKADSMAAVGGCSLGVALAPDNELGFNTLLLRHLDSTRDLFVVAEEDSGDASWRRLVFGRLSAFAYTLEATAAAVGVEQRVLAPSHPGYLSEVAVPEGHACLALVSCPEGIVSTPAHSTTTTGAGALAAGRRFDPAKTTLVLGIVDDDTGESETGFVLFVQHSPDPASLSLSSSSSSSSSSASVLGRALYGTGVVSIEIGHPHEPVVFTGHADHCVRVWDFDTGNPLLAVQSPIGAGAGNPTLGLAWLGDPETWAPKAQGLPAATVQRARRPQRRQSALVSFADLDNDAEGALGEFAVWTLGNAVRRVRAATGGGHGESSLNIINTPATARHRVSVSSPPLSSASTAFPSPPPPPPPPTQRKNTISGFSVQHPFVLVLTQDATLMALDLETGRVAARVANVGGERAAAAAVDDDGDEVFKTPGLVRCSGGGGGSDGVLVLTRAGIVRVTVPGL